MVGTINILDEVKTSFAAMKAEFEATVAQFQAAAGDGKEELKKTLDSLAERIEKTEAHIKAQEKILIPGLDKQEKKKISWQNLLIVATRAWTQPNMGWLKEQCKAERALVDEFHKNHMPHMDEKFLDAVNIKAPISAASDEAGAILVPMDLMSDIIPELEAMEVNAQLGVTQVFGLTGDIKFPKDKGGILAEYLDTEIQENITKTSSTFEGRTARPHPMAALVDLTWAMVRQAAINVEGFTRGRIAKKIALREDLTVFNGTGSGEPLGITNLKNKQTLDWTVSPGAPSFTGNQNISTGIREGYGKLRSADVPMDALGIVTSAQGYDRIFGTLDGDSREIFTTPDGAPRPNIQGGKVLWSTQLRNTDADEKVLQGNFSEGFNMHWGTLALASSTEAGDNFKNVSLSVRGVMAHDFLAFHDEAFVEWENFDITAP